MGIDSNEEDVIINKYGQRVHEIGIPQYNMYEDTRMCINPDLDHVIDVIKKIHEGNGRCPSKKCYIERPFGADTDCLVPDTRCPCPEFLCKGTCECGLFVPLPIVPSLSNKEEEKKNETN